MTAENQTSAQRDISKPDPFYAYNGLSIVLHWVTVLMIIALAFSAGGLHLSLGLLFAIVLLWRAVRRWGNGFPRVSDQPLVLNFIERLAKITILVAMIVLALTGVILPLMQATPYTLFGLASWQPPLVFNETGAALLRAVHDFAAWSLYGAIAVHLIAAVKHMVTIKDGIILRIVKPVSGGK